jgi:hypothetical protein
VNALQILSALGAPRWRRTWLGSRHERRRARVAEPTMIA